MWLLGFAAGAATANKPENSPERFRWWGEVVQRTGSREVGAGGGVMVLGAGVGSESSEAIPEEVENDLGGEQAVEGHRQGQVLLEAGQVELGASKLPFHIGTVLWASR